MDSSFRNKCSIVIDHLNTDHDARIQIKEETSTGNIVKTKSGKRIDKAAKIHIGILTEVIYGGINNFTICKIDAVVCKGKIKDPVIGASYSLTGKFIWMEKFRDYNFEFDAYEVKIDVERGLIQYLIREAPGLGPKTAASLVRLHGFRLMELLRGDEPVAGISTAQHKALQQWAKTENTNSNIKERLYSIGLTPSQVKKLLDHYGSNAEMKIRKDCFSLTEIYSFGFKTVSAIANLIGIPTYDPGRIKAAVIYAADYLTQDHGHVCLRLGDVVSEACALLSLKQEVVLPVIVQLLEEEELLVSERTKFKDYAQKHGIILA